MDIDTIRFILKPEKEDFFNEPIALSIKSTQEAVQNGYTHWDTLDNFYFKTEREYKGYFVDSLTIAFEEISGNRTSIKKFIKESL